MLNWIVIILKIRQSLGMIRIIVNSLEKGVILLVKWREIDILEIKRK